MAANTERSQTARQHTYSSSNRLTRQEIESLRKHKQRSIQRFNELAMAEGFQPVKIL